MYAYVKDLTEGVPDPFTYVHTSRIFQYAAFPSGKNKGQRVNFNPLKHDVNTSYGIVHGREIVKHQVLLVKDTEEELKAIVNSQESERLRTVPCPKRLSTGPTREPLRSYSLVKEAADVKEIETKKTDARKKVAEMRNAKVLQQMAQKGSVKSNTDTVPEVPSGNKSKVDEDQEAEQDVKEIETKKSITKRKVTEPRNAKLLCVTVPEKKSKMDEDQLSNHVVQSSSVSTVSITEEIATSSNATASIKKGTKLKSPSDVCEQSMDEVHVPNLSSPGECAQECDKCSVLQNHLELALKQAEDYRVRCSKLEEEKEHNALIEKRLEKIESDIGYMKDMMESSKLRSEARRQAREEKPCSLSRLKDVSTTQDLVEVPHGQVHLADGQYFMTKKQLVKVENANGLRPRLKKLLTYMYQKDLPNWVCKVTKGSNGREIPERHIKAFIVLLQAMDWKKIVDLTYEKVAREVTKALSELKADKYPQSEPESESEDLHDAPPTTKTSTQMEANVGEGNGKEDQNNLLDSFHEEEDEETVNNGSSNE